MRERTVVTDRTALISPLSNSSNDSASSESAKDWTSQHNRRVAISVLFTHHFNSPPPEEDDDTVMKIKNIYPKFHLQTIRRVIEETRKE